MYESGDIKVFNPNKEISKEITLEILIRHRDALKQARTGELFGVPMDKIDDNQRKINQVRALNLIISAQREMITISRPIIFFRSTQKWKKKNKTEEEQKENPFEKDSNDYNKLIEWLDILKYCESAILEAEKTKKLDDDFMITRQQQDGTQVNVLTSNFFDMLDELESSYEQIYLLMLTNKIVSAGIEEDEEMTYKEKEQEAIRRVVEA
jgi:hypothetical protein